jgi:CubicO group peptidase (beta-lactamase class C family)
MKYSILEKQLAHQIESHMKDVTPGVLVRAYQNGRVVCDISVGKTYPYYDLASLTKIIFTNQVMMLAYENGAWNFDSRVKNFLNWFPSEDTRILDLLTHTSGMKWWQAFFKKIDLSSSRSERKTFIEKLLAEQSLSSEKKCVYSDLNFLTLMFFLQQIYQKDVVDIWKETKEIFYEGTTLDFSIDNIPAHQKIFYAPTEHCPWRKKLIQGEVHDENAWAMGGVSTHAGLFGSIDDVGWYALALRSQILGIARYHIRQKTALVFAERSMVAEVGDFAIGFMVPTIGASSSGAHFSPQSIGHTGFTGTSIWYDPKQDLSIVVLSNRLLYGRDNERFKNLRPQIHDWLVEGLRKSAL